MMKVAWKVTIACLCFAWAFSYIWPFVADPRAQGRPPTKMLGQISRTIFGEHCLETHRIGNLQSAVAYARQIWQVEKLKLTALGDEDIATSIFKSELFRDGGDRDRDLGGGWQARSGIDGWHVSYSVSDPAVAAYLSAEFTDCGRVTNSASKIFNLKK
jgi:hypothetical protein